MNAKKILIPTAIAALAMTGTAQAKGTDPDNSFKNVYFGKVVAGTHPSRVETVRNPTGRVQWIHRFDLAGAGGNKFRLSFAGMTCHVGTRLAPGATCTFKVRVYTERPEFWQSVMSVYYGSRHLDRKARGQFNAEVFARVVDA